MQLLGERLPFLRLRVFDQQHIAIAATNHQSLAVFADGHAKWLKGVYSETVERGLVATQTPGGGAQVHKGATITLTGGELSIDKSLSIEGLGSASLTVTAGTGELHGASRVFDIISATAVVNAMTS